MSKKISLIVSAYNEQDGLKQFHEVSSGVLKDYTAGHPEYEYEICYVNDGSTDSTQSVLEEIRESDRSHTVVIVLSRNFGHESAMTAGLDYADGDYLIFMDADLQHPPQCIPQIMEKFEEGYEVINMVRIKNESAGIKGNLLSSLFYKLINSISDVDLTPAASDFFAMGKKAAEVLRHNYREKVRFLRGFVQNIGFRKTTIDYEAAQRAAGSSHYSFKKLFRLSADAIICFSDLPLKLGIYAGLFSGFLGVLLIVYTLFTREGAPGGYTTVVTVMCFMFAVMFILLGVIGTYLSIMFREMRDRPVYIVGNILREDISP